MMVLPEFADLPPEECIERYLQLASDAREEAKRCNPRVREAYLIMAEHWEGSAITMALAVLEDVTQPQEFSRAV